MTIFTTNDPAGRTVAELGLLTMGLASVHDRAFRAGLAAMDRGIESRRAQRYQSDLAEARHRADELGNIAKEAVRRVAFLEAENRRLKSALEQRQAFIDRVRKGVAA